jgi:hypothetical protein
VPLCSISLFHAGDSCNANILWAFRCKLKCRTLPVGLCGVLRTSSLVAGLKAASSSPASMDQFGCWSCTILQHREAGEHAMQNMWLHRKLHSGCQLFCCPLALPP